MTKRTKFIALLVGVVAVLAIGGGVAVGANPWSQDLTPKPAVAAASSDLQDSFGVLRSGANVTAASAAFKKELADEPLMQSNGGNIDRAVVVSTESGKAWIVPGKDSVCIYQENPPGEYGYGGTCGSTAEAKSGKIATWSMGQDGEILGGVALVPDGADVSTTDASGRRTSVGVTNNVVGFGGKVKLLTIDGQNHKF